MKIAVISVFAYLRSVENYGSLLQYFALQTYLKKRGHEVYWIRYYPERIFSFSYLNPVKLFNWILKNGKKIFTHKKKNEFAERKSRQFDVFIKKHIYLSEKEFYSVKDLKHAPPHADAYIVGSDQVWMQVNEGLFLNFVPRGKKRIAYAVSAPWNGLSRAWFRKAPKLARFFDAISVRESDGMVVCKKIGRSDAVHVLDPTMLLEKNDYLSIASGFTQDSATPSAFLLTYFVNISSLSEVCWGAIENYSSVEKLTLLAIPLQGAETAIPVKYQFKPNVEGWLASFFSAQEIITNSFHGVLFSILAERPFLVILQKGKTARENCRFFSILTCLNLTDRIYQPDLPLNLQMKAKVDWENVRFLLNQARNKSKDFIINSGL